MKTEIDRKHKGSASELVACAWLLSHGFEVFRNVSSHGSVDVVAIKGKDLLKIDVTGASIYKGNFSRNLQKERAAKQHKITVLYVFPTGDCRFSSETLQAIYPMCRPVGPYCEDGAFI